MKFWGNKSWVTRCPYGMCKVVRLVNYILTMYNHYDKHDVNQTWVHSDVRNGLLKYTSPLCSPVVVPIPQRYVTPSQTSTSLHSILVGCSISQKDISNSPFSTETCINGTKTSSLSSYVFPKSFSQLLSSTLLRIHASSSSEGCSVDIPYRISHNDMAAEKQGIFFQKYAKRLEAGILFL